VRYLILEKVLFQKIIDYKAVSDLLSQKGVAAWVNCPRRVWPFYRELRDKFCGVENVDYTVSGSNLGIGCNAIHYIDHMAFLTGQDKFTFYGDQLDVDIIPSKRPGFIEFTGTLSGRSTDKSQITLVSYKGGNAPLLIQINSDNVRCIIMEDRGIAWVSQKSDWEWQEIKFSVPYQSRLTHLIVQQIMDTGSCGLPVFEESCKLHVPFLEVLIAHLRKQGTEIIDLCSIT
jgi:hypothetical protein